MEHSVLFVCMGNICRSPAGEGLFHSLVEEKSLEDHIRVDSAGTIAYHQGKPPDARMRQAAARRGYRLEGQARQIEAEDLGIFDLVIAMDHDNYSDIQALASGHRCRAEIRMLSHFLPDGSLDEVPDPYYGGEQGFETVLDMIEQAGPAILEHLLAAR